METNHKTGDNELTNGIMFGTIACMNIFFQVHEANLSSMISSCIIIHQVSSYQATEACQLFNMMDEYGLNDQRAITLSQALNVPLNLHHISLSPYQMKGRYGA